MGFHIILYIHLHDLSFRPYTKTVNVTSAIEVTAVNPLKNNHHHQASQDLKLSLTYSTPG